MPYNSSLEGTVLASLPPIQMLALRLNIVISKNVATNPSVGRDLKSGSTQPVLEWEKEL